MKLLISRWSRQFQTNTTSERMGHEGPRLSSTVSTLHQTILWHPTVRPIPWQPRWTRWCYTSLPGTSMQRTTTPSLVIWVDGSAAPGARAQDASHAASQVSFRVSQLSLTVSQVNLAVSDLSLAVSLVNLAVSQIILTVSQVNYAVSHISLTVSQLNLAVSHKNLLVNQ